MRIFFIGFLLLVFLAMGNVQREIGKEEILSYENWQDVYHNFDFDDSLLEALKTRLGRDLRIDVFLAFWCIDSERNVPGFLKIIDNMDDENLLIHYYLVDRKSNKEMKYYVEKLKVDRIPTFIFYRDDNEIGRIVENPKKSLIEDFLEIIF